MFFFKHTGLLRISLFHWIIDDKYHTTESQNKPAFMCSKLPLTLYIHIPWCIQKCPYCDFNSHKLNQSVDENHYIDNLIKDLKNDSALCSQKQLSAIFIGGGTPSLLSARAYERLFNTIQQLFSLEDKCEITLEANPGTVDQQRFKEYRAIGINRLSLGIQSFNDAHLKRLGRIHDGNQAHKAIHVAREAGFDNLNLDIMHGLPNQSIEQGLEDLRTAIESAPEHLSWYQLTIEPNTVFYSKPPKLPNDDNLWELETAGFELLKTANYTRYEISAFSKSGKQCQHNKNYWLFGDYLGIGAGAHAKITTDDGILRLQKTRQPKDYLNPKKPFICQQRLLNQEETLFEFMLNVSRLEQPIPFDLFSKRTSLSQESLLKSLQEAIDKKLLTTTEQSFQVTPLGRQFTNELQALFL